MLFLERKLCFGVQIKYSLSGAIKHKNAENGAARQKTKVLQGLVITAGLRETLEKGCALLRGQTGAAQKSGALLAMLIHAGL